MSTFILRKMTRKIFVLSLLGFSTCYASEAILEKSDTPMSVPAPKISSEEAGSSSEGDQRDTSTYSGLMSGFAKQLHQIIDEERIKMMSEIDKERQETQLFLTQERLVATEDVSRGVSRVLESLSVERIAILNELEAMGNRISEQTINDGKQLVDHFFVRLVQFTIVFSLLAGLIAFLLRRRKRALLV